jgi:hypothetical protein
MLFLENEQALRQSFREIDREEVILPSPFSFPMKAQDYLSWLEPSGCRAFLIFRDPSFRAPLGIVWRRDQSVGPSAPAMCEWCQSVRSGNEIGLLTVASRSHRRVGVSLCRDLSCAEKLRSHPGSDDWLQHAPAEERIVRLIAKMAAFARQNLI